MYIMVSRQHLERVERGAAIVAARRP
jgi:hypothetical protein